MTPSQALQFLADLGAPPWLVRHHELVLEAATQLCDGVQRTAVFDREQVLVGAALHDLGKLLHPDEMHAPGNQHEAAGEQLLLARGIPTHLARFCVTHAAWDRADATLEDLLVALADKLWKGKRVDELEQLFIDRVASTTQCARWFVYSAIDPIFQEVADDGPARLARSNV